RRGPGRSLAARGAPGRKLTPAYHTLEGDLRRAIFARRSACGKNDKEPIRPGGADPCPRGRSPPGAVMGIYDRDYYRKEGPSFLGSRAEGCRVTPWLIGLNVVCFILQFVTRTAGTIPGPDGPIRVLGEWHEPFTDALILDPNRVFA